MMIDNVSEDTHTAEIGGSVSWHCQNCSVDFNDAQILRTISASLGLLYINLI